MVEGQARAIPETEEKLFSEFKALTTEEILLNKEGRQNQVIEQNKVIDRILKISSNFVLESKVKHQETNQTIFTYLDPDHTNPNDPCYKEKQVIYIQNDFTKEIDVLYGAKACVLIIERPNQVKNGLIAKIDKNKIEHYGEIKDCSIFKSFKKIDLPKLSTTGILQQARYQNLIESNRLLS